MPSHAMTKMMAPASAVKKRFIVDMDAILSGKVEEVEQVEK
jgi:hypothetical protein